METGLEDKEKRKEIEVLLIKLESFLRHFFKSSGQAETHLHHNKMEFQFCLDCAYFNLFVNKILY